jgi:hypothetical protein
MPSNRKLTIDEMQEIARERGGQCLSEQYTNNRIKLVWRCRLGHKWQAAPGKIKQGQWCPICAVETIRQKATKYRLADMLKIAQERGGTCLSKKFVNVSTHLQWRCSDGHVWEAKPNNILNGRWCPKCARKKIADKQRHSIDEMIELARSRGGECLSKTYVNNRTRLEWKCSRGHRWGATPHHIILGTWCPTCADEATGIRNRKYSIEDMQRVAHERGGECLSENFISLDRNLEWRCSKGHRWKARAYNVISKVSWCPYCSGNARLTIDDMRQIAKQRHGICLSEEYINSSTKLKWQCNDKHEWEANPSKILGSQWCPICSIGLGERICRIFFEKLFDRSFPKSRPKWLKNKDGNQMELDGHCKSLNLAFEHQGEQHFAHKKHFHSEEAFQKRKHDDLTKEELCKKHEILLIKVPEIPRFLDVPDVKSYIIDQCNKAGFDNLPQDIEAVDVHIDEAYTSGMAEYLSLIKGIAEQRGGRCLSDYYAGNFVHLSFQCKEGHIWKATPANIKRGKWCPYCAGKYKTISDMQKMAKAREGKCLSEKYVNDTTKLKWQCKKGHIWETTPGHVKGGSWCPECAGRKPKIIT